MDRENLISDNFNREKTRKIKFFSKQIYCIPSYVHFDNFFFYINFTIILYNTEDIQLYMIEGLDNRTRIPY